MSAAAGDLVLFVVVPLLALLWLGLLVASALTASRRGRRSRVSRWVREL
jgi:hypothetical protein